MIKNKKEDTKEAFDFNSKKIVYAICALVVFVGLFFLITKIVLKDGSKKDDDKNNQNELGPKPDEKTVEDEYGFTKEEAINIVKTIFNSDNYVFSAEVNSASKYVVTVTNSVDKSKMIFIVDPITKEYTMQQ